MQIIPGPTSIELAKNLAKQTSWSLLIPEYKLYGDGETAIRIPETPSQSVLIIQSLHNPQELNLFNLLNLVLTLKDSGTQQITCFIPYLCYARADKSVLAGEAKSAETVLKLLEFVGINKIIVLDIHNPAIFDGLVTMEAINVYPIKAISKYLQNKIDPQRLKSDVVVIAPDQGAIERAKLLAKELEISWVHMTKNRDPNTGRVEVFFTVKLDKKKVILIDDIMSTGNSLVKASYLLATQEIEQINVIVTHAIGTNAVDKLKELGNGFVVSTKSIPGPIAKIGLIPDLLEVLNN